MLTTRTPLRVSFFGGGTDYPEYFERYPGAVIGTTINKYIYISCLKLESIVGYNYRLSYRINEEINHIDQVQHPVFKALLSEFKIEKGWNFSVMSSLPSGSGLGSSSAFTVGLIKLLSELKGSNLTRYDLARKAINIEKVILRENVGVQDQIHAAYGSMNRYDFYDGKFNITPIRMSHEMRDLINQSMYLIFTGTERHASAIVTDQVSATKDKKLDKELSHLYKLVDESQFFMESYEAYKGIREIGRLLDESWKTKRSLSASVSSPTIDSLYEKAKSAGALGGKLCGAGGGGFFLIIALPDSLEAIAQAIQPLQLIPISMDESGSTLIYQ